MERLYGTCMERIATLSGTNVSAISSIDVYVYLCKNLSSHVYTSRKTHDVIDFADIFPLDIALPVLGVASPFVIILTFILNVCVVKVLTEKKLRSPTNALLVTIAILDLVTGCLRLPWYINTYSLQGYKYLPNETWCYYYYYLFRVTPTIIHMTSLWCTVLLAFQRYVGVSQLRRIGCVCQYKGLTITIVIIALCSLVVHCFQLILIKLESITVTSNQFFNLDGSASYTNTCAMVIRDEQFNIYFSQYYGWIRLILAQVLPCVCLAIFNFLLLRITVKGYRYRRHLVRGNKVAQNRELKATLRMSIMLVLITGSTLLAEAFVAVLLLIETTQNHSHYLIIEHDTISKSIVISNFLILFTFPLNFMFYFAMSSRFRRYFTMWFIQRKRRRIVPLLGAPRYVGHHYDEEEDEDDEDEPEPEVASPVPLNNLQLNISSHHNSKEASKSNPTSSQVL
ncbi:hypothetical protein SNE40_015531 [Patella caerulea]|uniref:G-protein coupled receptors family 1 profile domain-containing protein n=1 Tax=Patella caerulea TaxID=87958 RepID=A0AAN8JH48_PATCE